MAKRPRNPARGLVEPASNDGGETVNSGGDNGGSTAGNDNGTVDPGKLGTAASGDAANGSGEPGKRGRGRPAGSRTRAKSAPLDLGDFADILLVAHAGLASALRIETLAITSDEAEKLAKAAQNVARHYELPGIAQETKDWIGLIVACASVYGPRITAAWVAGKAPPRGDEEPDTATPVIKLHGGPRPNTVPGLMP